MDQQPNVTDYTAMDEDALRNACGADASKWSAAFCQHADKLGHIDEVWVTGWFANAIDHAHFVREEINEQAADYNED